MAGSSLASSKQRIISAVVLGVKAFLLCGRLMVICTAPACTELMAFHLM